MIVISLDYDKTYTLLPDMWLDFVKNAPPKVKIYCITMRYPEEGDSMDSRLTALVPVIFTSRQAKRKYVEINEGLHVDIWIDDEPNWILTDSF